MAYTQTDIDNLKSVIASGVLSLKHGDTMTVYRDLASARAALALMEAEVNPSTQSRRRTLVSFSRGL